VRDAFADDRYITVDGKPLFIVFRPDKIADPIEFTDCWRELAHESGFKGLYLLGILNAGENPGALGLDGGVHKGLGHLLSFLPLAFQRRAEARRRSGVLLERPGLALMHQAIARSRRPSWLGPLDAVHDAVSEQLLLPSICSYRELVDLASPGLRVRDDEFPCVIPSWDNTPRLGRWGWVLQDSTPELFAQHLGHALSLIEDRPPEKRLVFLKSWNEWAEGNYLEPDERYGRGYLEAIRRELSSSALLPGRELGA
jgi:hypothetical protein